MSTLISAIISHTQEVCQQVVPMMEQSGITTNTSTVQLGEYTVTLTLTKKGLLGKRKAAMVEEVSSPREWRPVSKKDSEFYPKPSSDAVLFNNLGHNFCHMNPHPPMESVSVPFYIS
jgi:hypothetical protein